MKSFLSGLHRERHQAWLSIEGARLVVGPLGLTSSVVIDRSGWPVRVGDTDSEGDYTEVIVPFVPTEDFKLRIVSERGMQRLGKWLGRQDIQVGDAALDQALILRSDQPEKVAPLVTLPELRQALLALNRVDLRIGPPAKVWAIGTPKPTAASLDHGDYTALEGPIAVVHVNSWGLPIMEEGAAKSVELVEAVLRALVESGLASPEPPRV